MCSTSYIRKIMFNYITFHSRTAENDNTHDNGTALSHDVQIKVTLDAWIYGNNNFLLIKVWLFTNNAVSNNIILCDQSWWKEVHKSKRLYDLNWRWNKFCHCNWQKWEGRFLTCPCHKIYRVEAVGLSTFQLYLKITCFVKMWNLRQYCLFKFRM